jgi:S-adenosylmethionine uptake transporter
VSTPAHGNLRGIVAMVASQASFIVNDALIKLATRDLPGGQAIFIRGVMAFLMTLVTAAALGLLGPWPARQDWPRIASRNIGEIGSTFFYLFALFNMPMADATAILQFLPLAIMGGAALFLGEPVGWRRWTAALVGFAGVLIVIRPGTAGFTAWSLLALAGMLFSTLRDLSTRSIPGRYPTLLLVVLSAATVTIAAASFSLIEDWGRPSPKAMLLLAGAAVFLIGGYYFIVDAMRHGEVAVVAPFRYSVIVFAIVAGIVLFGEWPDATALAGSIIVCGAGLYTYLREQALRRMKGGS